MQTVVRNNNDMSMSLQQVWSTFCCQQIKYTRVMDIIAATDDDDDAGIGDEKEGLSNINNTLMSIYSGLETLVGGYGYIQYSITHSNIIELNLDDPRNSTTSLENQTKSIILVKTDEVRVDDTSIIEITFLENSKISIVFLSSLLEDQHLQQMVDEIESYVKETNDKLKNIDYHGKWFSIVKSYNSFKLEKTNLSNKRSNFTDDFIYKNYNDNFSEVNERIFEKINNNSNGLILLHGLPGTGKTNYIRYLISSINRKLVFLPSDMVGYLSDPSLIKFMKSSLKDAILVIEDAELVIASRDNHSGNHSATSNILNLTDGLMGDSTNILFICTFNTHRDNIDKALLRKGRLVAEYQFDVLDKQKTSKLIKDLYGLDYNGSGLALTEIYNFDEKELKTKVKEKTFGFAMSNNNE